MKKVWIPLIIIAVLVGAYFGSSAVFAARAEKGLAALKALGFPVTPAEMAARYGSGVNPTGRMLNTAAANLEEDLRHRLPQIESLAATSDPAAADSVVRSKSAVIATLMAVADSPPATFGLKYDSGFTARLPEILPALPSFQTLLRLDARLLARAGKPDSALCVLRAAVRMNSIMSEPTLIHVLAEIVGFDSTCALLGRFASTASPTARKSVADELSRFDIRELLIRAIAGDAILNDVTATRQGPLSDEEGQLLLPYLRFAPLRNYARDVALRITGPRLAAAALPWHEGRAEIERIEAQVTGAGLRSRIVRIATPKVEIFYARAERASARRDAALLGLAVLDYRAQTGRLPATLAEAMPSGPFDPFTGRAFLYKVEPDGFTVYSTGRDETDHEGNAVNDIVFIVPLDKDRRLRETEGPAVR